MKEPALFSFDLKNIGELFLSSLFPKRCVLCGEEGSFLCLKHSLPPAPKNEARFEFLDQIFVTTSYSHKDVSRIVEFYKFRGVFGLSAEISQRMMLSVSDPALFENAVLVPVPLYWTRFLWRGYNQAEILARNISTASERPLFSILERKKKTLQQARLPQEKRFQNIKNAFTLKGSVDPQKKYILVDDVVASGATLDECARMLKLNGAVRVEAFVFARGGGN